MTSQRRGIVLQISIVEDNLRVGGYLCPADVGPELRIERNLWGRHSGQEARTQESFGRLGGGGGE